MPVCPNEHIKTRARLLIWKLEETAEELYSLLPVFPDMSELATIAHPQKRKEWMASRILLRQLAESSGISYRGTFKDDHGKPFLCGSEANISITNTAEYVVAALDCARAVGIDMEPVTDKLVRASKKFLSDAEFAHAGTNLNLLSAYWCAKEAMFKLNGRASVSFRQAIYVDPFAEDAAVVMATLRDKDHVIRQEVKIFRVDSHCLAVTD